ncbi:hypothetical protein E1I18_00100 [Mycoplasmopsis mucosicanis]|uniref:Lipoprotein n=1 Tax=Mycoplasmopsis mucosicanis TaxID=458208 RepID=A0A507SSU5_9BACT|nr:hypothetical protein [Mycoplasmopsis mucosicanis]TQC54166.1 hypothetical protein E1I18_00100 [Mycoplasmopsis mucosicanis]
MLKKIFLTPALLTPLSIVACSNSYVSKDAYVIEYNKPNPNIDNFAQVSGVFGSRNTLHDSLVGNYFLRYKFIGESKYDYLNNYFLHEGISAKFMKFGFIKAIKLININGEEHLFDSDDDDVFDKPNKFIPRDINRGYQNYLYTLKSKNPRSINSNNFIQKLSTASKIEFIFNEQKWYDSKGNITNNDLKPTDVINSFKRAELSSNQLNYLSLVGFKDLLNLTKTTEKSVIFTLNESIQPNTLLSEILNNKIFSAYKENHYAGSYYLFKNDAKHTKYKSLKNSDIKTVILKYNSLGKTDIETHRLHLINEYNQGLISSQNISTFNNLQQQNLIQSFKTQNSKTKLNIVQTKNNSKKLSILFKDKKQNDSDFSKLMFGKSNKLSDQYRHFYNGPGLIFRNNITQILNKFSINFIANKTQYYDNFINPDAQITNAFNTNYVRIRDAYDHVNNNIIFNENGDITQYYSDENKAKYYTNESYINLREQLKNVYFGKIKDSLTKLLNNNNITAPIDIFIPIETTKLDINLINEIEILLNNIDKRLRFKLTNLHDEKSKTDYNFIDLDAKSTQEYLTKILSARSNNLLIALDYIDEQKFPYLARLKKMFETEFHYKFKQNVDELSSLIESNQFKANIDLFVFKVHKMIGYFDIIKLINEIKVLYSVPYDLDSNIDLDNFKYELLQPWFTKPTRDDDLIYFEDIKVDGV